MLHTNGSQHYKKTRSANHLNSGQDEAEIIVRFIPIVERAVAKYLHISDVYDLEDFSQMCLIELMNLIRKGDQDFESKEFESYFKNRCILVIKSAVRSSSMVSHHGLRAKAKHANALKEAIKQCGRPVSDLKLIEMGLISEKEIKLLYWNAESDAKVEFDETIHTISKQSNEHELVELLKAAIGKLDSNDQLILKLLYQDDLSQSEVAKVLKVKSQQVISYQLKKIYTQLATIMTSLDTTNVALEGTYNV